LPAGVDVRDPAYDGARYSVWSARWYQVAGQTDDIWVLDVDGRRQVLAYSSTRKRRPISFEQVEQLRDTVVIEPF